MTLANQKQILDTLMPDVVTFVMNGMNVTDAVREAINKQNAFICEMIDGQTERAKTARNVMFARFMDNFYGQQLAKVVY